MATETMANERSDFMWPNGENAGYPERFAQQALGHNSKAVHRAYARKAKVELPSLSEYERQRTLFTKTSKDTLPLSKVG
jgi:hypothetical protein